MPPEADICWLCARPMATLVEWHHPVPRQKRGRIRVAVHPICHRTIHAHFTNAQLARTGADVDAVRAHPEVARFIEWIANKPPDFHASTHKPR